MKYALSSFFLVSYDVPGKVGSDEYILCKVERKLANILFSLVYNSYFILELLYHIKIHINISFMKASLGIFDTKVLLY